jgi:peptidylprolyl isomerase
MIRYYLLFIFFLGNLFLSFGQNPNINPDDFITTESGLQYYIFQKGEGNLANEGDIIYVHYIGRLADSTIFENTYDKNYPLIVTLGMGQVINGWEEGFTYLHEGDKALMVVPPELGYGKNSNYDIPPDATLYFLVEILHVIKGQKILPIPTDGKDTIETKTGLKYIIIDEGYGKYPRVNEIITVDYTGFLSTGKIFDSSVKKKKPFKFIFGQDEVLDAWEVGLKNIKEGGIIKLIIPSELAYGESGFKNIVPPNEELIFDINLIEVKPEIIIKPYHTDGKEVIKTKSGLEITIIENGEGVYPDTNNIVTIHYTGYFKNGEIFDSSVKRDEPIRFPLGIGAVISGLEETLFQINVGTKARIFVPYKIGYGKKGNPPSIPKKADLIFDIELIDVM